MSTDLGRPRPLWYAASSACGLGVGVEVWPFAHFLGRRHVEEIAVPTVALLVTLLVVGVVGRRQSGDGSWARATAGLLGVVAAGLAGSAAIFTPVGQVLPIGWVAGALLVSAGLLHLGAGSAELPISRAGAQAAALGAAALVGVALLLSAQRLVTWLVVGADHPIRSHVLLRGGLGLLLVALLRRPAGWRWSEALVLLGAGLAAFPLSELAGALAITGYGGLGRHGAVAEDLAHVLLTRSAAVYLALGLAGLALAATASRITPPSGAPAGTAGPRPRQAGRA